MPTHGQPDQRKDTWRVLHADGDPLSRDALRLFLEFLEIEVVSVSTAEAFLETFHERERAFDLVLLDFETPGDDTAIVVAEIRRDRRDQPIGITGSFPERQVFRNFPESDAISFLRKPITVAKLRRYLWRAIPRAVPTVVGLSDPDGPIAAAWSRALHGDLDFCFSACPERAFECAEEGFPRVLLWDIRSAVPRSDQIERLREAEVPFAFWGPDEDLLALESAGPVIVDSTSGSELCRCLRSLGAAAPTVHVTM